HLPDVSTSWSIGCPAVTPLSDILLLKLLSLTTVWNLPVAFMSPLQSRSPVVLLPLCLRFLTVQLGSAIGVGGCFDADCSGVMHCMVCTGSPIPGIFTPICFIMAASSAESCGMPFIFTVTAMSHWPAL